MSSLATTIGRVAVPLVTPFDQETENVNFDVMARLIDFVIERDYCDSLVLTGTTGEFSSLTLDERVEIWRLAKQVVNRRVPLIAGIGASSTREAIALCLEADRVGFDALMVIVPFYCRPTQDGIEQHFRAVAAATTTPILVYNIPLFTGANIEPQTLARIAELRNIQGIKDQASINPIQVTRFAQCTASDFAIYCGDDTMLLQVMLQRGVGVVSGGAAVVGQHIKRMIAAYLAGDTVAASRCYFSVAPFFGAFGQNGRINPVPILRAAIEIASGLAIGPPRRPLQAATADEIAVIRPLLETLDAVVTVDR